MVRGGFEYIACEIFKGVEGLGDEEFRINLYFQLFPPGFLDQFWSISSQTYDN